MLMNSSEKMLHTLKSRLPEHWQAALDELAASTLQAATPLWLTLVGGFSVGKSSLLNTLLGEPLLFTAKEETTALPTFLEYGESPGMTLSVITWGFALWAGVLLASWRSARRPNRAPEIADPSPP